MAPAADLAAGSLQGLGFDVRGLPGLRLSVVSGYPFGSVSKLLAHTIVRMCVALVL